MLLAARPASSSSQLAGFLGEHASSLAWDEFLAVTFAHRLGQRVSAGLGAAGLGDTATSALPAHVSAALREQETRNRLRVMQLLHAESQIASLLHPSGFPTRVLKGYALARTLYGSPTARHCGDLDLLANDRDLARQVALMMQLGYRITEPEVAFTPKRLAIYRRHWKGLTFQHGGTGMVVDLHWRLFNNPVHAGNRLIEVTESPTAEDLFLYTALHGASDAWVYLKSLSDVAAFVHQFGPPELESALHRAQGLGVLQQVSSAVHLAAEYFGTPAASHRLLPVTDPFHHALRAAVEDRLRGHSFRPRRVAQTARIAFQTELGQVPGLHSAAQIVARYLWRPRVWSRFPLSDALLWLTPVLGMVLPPRGAHPAAGTLKHRGESAP